MNKIIQFLTIITILFIASCEKEPNPEDIVTGKFVYLENYLMNEDVGIFMTESNNIYFEKKEIPFKYRNVNDTINVNIVYTISEEGNDMSTSGKIIYIKKID